MSNDDDDDSKRRPVLFRSEEYQALEREAARRFAAQRKVAPGSPDSIARGCTCSPEDNCNGDGAPFILGHDTVTYIVAEDCKLHHGTRDWLFFGLKFEPVGPLSIDPTASTDKKWEDG